MAVYFLSESYLARPEAAMVVAVIDDAELPRVNTMDRFLRTDAVSSVSGMLYCRSVDVRSVPYLECYVMLRHDIVCAIQFPKPLGLTDLYLEPSFQIT